jgi:cytochrome b561
MNGPVWLGKECENRNLGMRLEALVSPFGTGMRNQSPGWNPSNMPVSSILRYDRFAMALHWLIALLVIPMLFFGEELMDEEAGSGWLPSLHVSIGVTVLALSLIRLVWRLANPPPPLPHTMHRWEVAASKITHLVFYLLLIGLPLSGWLALPEFIAEHPPFSDITAFGWTLPKAPNIAVPAGEIHEIASKIGIALLALHVIAALKHQFWNRDGVLLRMLPGR